MNQTERTAFRTLRPVTNAISRIKAQIEPLRGCLLRPINGVSCRSWLAVWLYAIFHLNIMAQIKGLYPRSQPPTLLSSSFLHPTSHEPERAPAGGEARAKDNIDEAKKHLHQTPSNSLARKPAQRLAVAFDRSSSFSFAAAITGEGFISFLLRQKAAFSSGTGVGGTRARKAELIFSF